MQEGKMLRINGTWKKNRTVVCVSRALECNVTGKY